MNHDDFNFTPKVHYEICATLEKIYLGFCKNCPEVQELIVNYEWLSIRQSSTWKPFLKHTISNAIMTGGITPEFRLLQTHFRADVNEILDEDKIPHPIPY